MSSALTEIICDTIDSSYASLVKARQFLGFVKHPSKYATKARRDPKTKDPIPPTTPAQKSRIKLFDYIIIGGGTAGCVLANRLSEDPDVTVLLLEAGDTDQLHILSIVPGTFFKLYKRSVDWDFSTEPEANLANRKMFSPRFKGLGGCSSMNAMMFDRGAPKDFDLWGELTGDASWNYQNILPYFQKSETNYIEEYEQEYHGKNGPWPMSYPLRKSPGSFAFLEAAQASGIPLSKDINGSSALGLSRVCTFTKNGYRYSTNASYLTGDVNVVNRKNLVIGTGAHVTKILMENDGFGLRAVGVEFKGHDNEYYHVFANQEVVLCAGTYQSPHLLLLSGIGPRSELEKHNIPVIKDLPGVGQNLEDHLFCPIVWEAKNNADGPELTFNQVDRGPRIATNFMRYWFTKNGGPLTSNFSEVFAFLRTRDTTLPKDPASSSETPHLELIYICGYAQNHGFNRPVEKDCFSLGPVLLTPFSKGYISLKSSNPFDKPLVFKNYLSDPNDAKMLIDGLKKSEEIIATWKTLTFKAIEDTKSGDTIWKIVTPDEDIKALKKRGIKVMKGSDMLGEQYVGPANYGGDYLKFIQNHAETLYHPTGTCKMGKDSDPMAVVNSKLQVRGVHGLRVVDAAVMPRIVAGHTCPPVVMIAEKAADMMKEQRKENRAGFAKYGVRAMASL